MEVIRQLTSLCIGQKYYSIFRFLMGKFKSPPIEWNIFKFNAESFLKQHNVLWLCQVTYDICIYIYFFYICYLSIAMLSPIRSLQYMRFWVPAHGTNTHTQTYIVTYRLNQPTKGLIQWKWSVSLLISYISYIFNAIKT